MEERPILFNTEMVKAILDGRKTQTRRVIKTQPHEGCGHIRVDNFFPTKIDRHGEEYPGAKIFGAYSDDGEWGCKCPYAAGDRLWVRETWDYTGQGLDCVYKADAKPTDIFPWEKYRPSIFMPRWASRITLEIVEIKVEKLQDINKARHDEIMLEGYPFGYELKNLNESPVHTFADVWDSINAKRGFSWESNPWCWCLSFKVE